MDPVVCTASGTNIAGSIGWSEDQRVSREGALIAHTLANAKLLFREEHIGSLEIGKNADLVVINEIYEIYEIYMTVGKAEDRYNQACYNYDKWQHCQFGKIHAIPYCLKAVYCAHLLILDK